jgi:hypothetical protein
MGRTDRRTTTRRINIVPSAHRSSKGLDGLQMDAYRFEIRCFAPTDALVSVVLAIEMGRSGLGVINGEA